MGRTRESVTSSLVPFLRDLISFAGMGGLKALVFVFLGVFLEGAGLLLLIPFLSLIIGVGPPSGPLQTAAARLFGFFSAETRFEKLGLLIGIFILLMTARAIVITIRDVTMIQLGLGFIQRIRSRLTRRLAAAEWDVISRLRHSRITHLMGADMQRLSSGIHMLFGDSVALVMLVSQIAIAIYLSPILATVAVSAALVGVVTLFPLLERARKFGEFVTDANLSLINDLTQFLGALKLAISQNLQGSFTGEFDDALEQLSQRQVQFVRQQTVTRLAVATLASVVGAAALVLGIAVLDVSPSVLITLLLIFSRMNGPAIQLHMDFQQFVQTLPAYETLRGLERELAAAPVQSFTASSLVHPAGAIRFHNVTFLHGGVETETLRHGGVRSLSLEIGPGTIVGITGPSGAGKTTFADLLVGLYPPQSGEIKIGDIELRGAAVPAWRNAVGYLTQDPFLFHNTIRHNLLWGNVDLDEAALWSALELAGVSEIVRRDARGLDAIVGERGSLLSGGERQRISLARAILRRPRLLVLDEATNAIDVDGERALLGKLARQAPRPTIVIIAHRPDSLQYCDRLLVFENGSIVSEDAAEMVTARLGELSRRTDFVRNDLETSRVV